MPDHFSAIYPSVIHVLKTWPEYYRPLIAGLKTFEIRLNDRSYHKDDVLVLREYDPDTGKYTGDFTVRRVLYVASFNMESGYVCMAISNQWNPKDIDELHRVREAEGMFNDS